MIKQKVYKMKIMKVYILLFFLFFHCYFCNAQQPPNDNDNQRVEVIKMAYISRQLNLSPQEAQNFWPVYNNYQDEIKQARTTYPDDELKYEQKVVEIKQRYQDNFKKVLGNDGQRVNKVYNTDRQFRDMIRSEYQNRLRQRQNFQQKQLNENGNDGLKHNNRPPKTNFKKPPF